MTQRFVRLLIGLIGSSWLVAGGWWLANTASVGAQGPAERGAARAPHSPARTPLERCGDLLAFQVRLDRQAFSPGEIDGRAGTKLAHALTALQTAWDLPATGKPDCDTWRALGSDGATPSLTTYVVTADDVNGPFEKLIPRALPDQAALPALGYQSVLEMLAERFHTSPALLRQLNPGVPIEAGRHIQVPNVVSFDPDKKPALDPSAANVTVLVSKEESSLRIDGADGTLLFFAPVTTGGRYDPLPEGDWKVTGVSWHPVFHYNPDLFWDAKPGDSKATIKPGPNNPVGVVWISLNLEHYGLHGSPEPGRIGQTESHGCVRLTNWDAARVASMVRPGTPVMFR